MAGGGLDDDGGTLVTTAASNFTAPATATYYIVAGAHAAHTGSRTACRCSSSRTITRPRTASAGLVSAGGTARGEIEGPGDADWFAVELVRGEDIPNRPRGPSRTGRGTLEDPLLLGIHDADGDLIDGTTNDDGGVGHNSRLEFVAPETGTYYIAAGAYEDHFGTYTLAVMDVL